MRMRSGFAFLILASVVVMFLAPAPAMAGNGSWISYAAKFVCNAESLGDDVVVQGKYKTVVNIHNPHNLVDIPIPEGANPVPVQFFKKAVLAQRQDEKPLPPSCHQEELLESNWGLGVDCDNIKDLLSLSGLPTIGDIEGFVVIEVPPGQGLNLETPTLDVTAVYTARPRTGIDPDVRQYDVRTMDVERVPETAIIGTPNIQLCDPKD